LRGLGQARSVGAEEAQLITAATQRRRRALVVDDDNVVLHVLSAALEEIGVECVHARDGRTALRVLAEELLSIDLLVTDLMMPGLGGEALVMTVRELGGERDLPILVASAHVEPERAEALRVAGVDAVVDKGQGLDPLVAAARELLAARGEPEAAVPAAPTPVPLFRIGLNRVRP